MVHNGIEYGMMQAYAEGFSIMQHKSDFALDLHQVAEIWRYGSVVRSWLLELTVGCLGQESDAGRHRPLGRGLRRRPLDGGRGHRSRRSRAGHHPVAARASALARCGLFADKLLPRCATSLAGTR